MIVKLNDVVDKISGNEDRFTTDLEYYLGGEHYECERIAIYKKGILKDDLNVLGFKFHFPFKTGDTIFMSRNPHLKKAGLVTFDGICSDTSYILRTKDKSILLERFLPLILQNDRFWGWFEENKSGSVNYLLNWKALKEYEFDLPPIENQKRISDLAWAIEETRVAYERMIAATDELVKSQFVEQFGDPFNNVHGYPVTTLKEVAVGPLSYGSVSSASEYDGTTRYIRITDISDNGTLGSDIKSAAKADDKYLLHDGDILFARTGATVGKTCRYRESYGRAIYAGFLIRLIPDPTLIDPDYLYHFTKSDYYWDFVKSAQRVVAQPNINAQEYGDLQILLPKMETQKQFATFVRQSDKSKFAVLRCSNLNL